MTGKLGKRICCGFISSEITVVGIGYCCCQEATLAYGSSFSRIACIMLVSEIGRYLVGSAGSYYVALEMRV